MLQVTCHQHLKEAILTISNDTSHFDNWWNNNNVIAHTSTDVNKLEMQFLCSRNQSYNEEKRKIRLRMPKSQNDALMKVGLKRMMH
jgi:hypothetical protein